MVGWEDFLRKEKSNLKRDRVEARTGRGGMEKMLKGRKMGGAATIKAYMRSHIETYCRSFLK